MRFAGNSAHHDHADKITPISNAAENILAIIKGMDETRFLSIRWRIMLPVFTLTLSASVCLVYVFSLRLPAASPSARQVIALMAATAAAALIVVLFVVVSHWTVRLNRIRRTARLLSSGQRTARTGMQGTDEIGQIGEALDRYAEYAQNKHDELRQALRQKRQELMRFLAVLESLPDGVVVQDLDGRVLLINDHARTLLGSQRVFRSAGLHELTAAVTDTVGPSIMPGLFALGSVQVMELDGRMLSVQAAAVMGETRLGTVVLMRDITAEVRQERIREALLRHLETNVQKPLEHIARGQVRGDLLPDFAREVTRHAVALQRIIVEIRDTANISLHSLQREQRPLLLEKLVWALINEWRQVAQGNNITLQVDIAQKGLYILGDERRLRWAVGNLLDNAIKYTLPGGTVSLEVRGEENGLAQLRIRDNGTGISTKDLPAIFTRFYRGTPTTTDGRTLHVPGMGQGLYVARQIIEAHGGAIRIKSKTGVGTAVYFTLPLTAPVGLELPVITQDLDGETVRVNPPLTRRTPPHDTRGNS